MRSELCALLLCTGCTRLNTAVHLDRAADLVERRVGAAPQWTAPWDDAPPDWSESTIITEQDAVETALRNNRELRAELEMIGAAAADLLQAGLLQNPVVNVMAMFPEGGGRAMLRGNAFPMQPLQDLWLIPARKRTAAAALQQTVLKTADRAVALAADVRRAYAEVRYAQRAVELMRGNIDLIEQSTALVRGRHAAGRATQVQVNVSRIRQLRLQSERIAMIAELRRAKRELLALMGLAAANDLWTATPMNETEDQVPSPISEAELVELALSQRLDLLAAQWSVTAARERVELARREGWPDLALGLTFERAPAPRSQNPTPAGRLGNAAFQAARGDLPAPEIGPPFSPNPREIKYTTGPMLDVELPIFDQNQAQIAKAVHEYAQTLATYESLVQETTNKVRQVNVSYDERLEQLRFFREAVLPEVESNLKLVEQSYRAGQEEFTVYLDVREDLIMTRLKTLEFLRDLHLARADIERHVGRFPHVVPQDSTPSPQGEN